MTRTATGWISSTVAGYIEPGQSDYDTEAHETGITEEDIRSALQWNLGTIGPADAQQEAELQSKQWSKEWACGQTAKDFQWPDIELLKTITRQEMMEALRIFPAETGLGWDAIHPRALTRISDDLFDELLSILATCELTGTWPKAVGMNIICMLPKPDGGYRPIGLLPTLPRVWMKARRRLTQEWERQTPRA